MRKLAIIPCLFIFLVSCVDDQVNISNRLDESLLEHIEKYAPDGSASYYILPSPDDYSRIPQDSQNPITEEKAALGRMLFFETGLGNAPRHEDGKKTYSCASCHIPEAAFGPGRVQGIGDGGIAFGQSGEGRTMHSKYSESELDIQDIRPLSLINVAFVRNTFWNGQFGGSYANIGTESSWDQSPATERNHWGMEAIETQNIEGLDVHRMEMNHDIAEHYGYKALFDRCFPEMDSVNRYSNMAASMAISAYIRTILSTGAPFQEWLKGEREAMTIEEKEGAILFFGKAKCASCHYEKNLGSSEFHTLGVKDMDQNPLSLNSDPDDPRHLGRGGFTGRSSDDHKFRVPGLYNISDSRFYFHGASKDNIEDVIRYKAKALRENPRIRQIEMSEKLHKLELSENEITRLARFLESALRDPDMERFTADSIHSGLCFPNNDWQSRMDLGCQ